MKLRESACLAAFLASVSIYPILATASESEPHVVPFDAHKPSFESQRRLIEDFFRAYEGLDFPKIRSLMVLDALKYIPAFHQQLDSLVPEYKDVLHSFRFLRVPLVIYNDHGEHGSVDIMADVELCDTISYFSRHSDAYINGRDSQIFYLFYHFHFDRKSGLINSLAPAYVKESNCTP